MDSDLSRRDGLAGVLVVLAALLAVASCSPDDSYRAGAEDSVADWALADRATADGTYTPPTPVVEDSAGVRVVTHPAPGDVPLRRLSPEPALRVGAPEFQLTRIAGAAVLSGGRVAVADTRSNEIHVVGPDGTPLARLGGEGGGPGEFRRLVSLAQLAGDSLATWDIRARRITVFAPDGTPARTAVLDPPPLHFVPAVLGAFPDGSVVLERDVDDERLVGGAEGVRRPPRPLLRYAADGTLVDTLAMLPSRERFFSRDELATGEAVVTFGGDEPRVELSWADVPYGPDGHAALAGGHLVVSPGDPYRIEWIDPASGRVVQVARREGVREVTDEAVRAAAEREAAVVEDPDRRGEIREAVEDLPRRAAMAPVTDLLADDRGRVWVREAAAADEPAVRWTVYGSDGTIAEEWLLPARLEVVRIANGRLVGVHHDELDVPEVVVFRLER